MTSAMQSSLKVYGSNLGVVWTDDPKSLGFRIARYTFVSKMFTGFGRVLEVGAGCGTLSKVVGQTVSELVLTDASPQGESVIRWNPLQGPLLDEIGFDGIYALDVMEHVHPTSEDAFLSGISRFLKPNGSLIIGLPSLEAWQYGSPNSLADHINNKTEEGLRATMKRHFHCVYLFGLNDATLHTGFGPMCHYRLALCNIKK